MTNEEQNILNDAAHQRIEDTLIKIDKRLEKVDTTLHGNGKPGLVVEVDRHTQTLSGMKKAFWILLTAGLTLACGAALALL